MQLRHDDVLGPGNGRRIAVKKWPAHRVDQESPDHRLDALASKSEFSRAPFFHRIQIPDCGHNPGEGTTDVVRVPVELLPDLIAHHAKAFMVHLNCAKSLRPARHILPQMLAE